LDRSQSKRGRAKNDETKYSGTTASAINQPQAKRCIDVSCHTAVKVKTKKTLSRYKRRPPSGE
jgi:hypothetical protein